MWWLLGSGGLLLCLVVPTVLGAMATRASGASPRHHVGGRDGR